MGQGVVVLVVDDEPMNRELISWVLGSDGYEVVCAQNGEDALGMLGAYAIDIVLMDVMMPVMDGLEAVQKIKADEALSHLPIIMLTALADEKTHIESLRLGVDDFLSKPIEIEGLRKSVRTLSKKG